MDEPNAHLDRQGERALMETIHELKKQGTTVIVITHRSNLLEHVDKVLLLHEGRIAMYGPRKEVLARIEESRLRQVQMAQQGGVRG
jgi:ABC-type protease/lipase transport system fused ATPase/permease subunit